MPELHAPQYGLDLSTLRKKALAVALGRFSALQGTQVGAENVNLGRFPIVQRDFVYPTAPMAGSQRLRLESKSNCP